MASRKDMYARFLDRQKRKPPAAAAKVTRYDLQPPNPGVIPGFGQYREARVTRNWQAHMGNHDGAPSPQGRGPFRPRRRGRTRPTPGSVYNRNKPQRN
jgi:hypothetical protein